MNIKCPITVLAVICFYGCAGMPKPSTTPKLCDQSACFLQPYNCDPEEYGCEYALAVKESSDKKSLKFNLRGNAEGFIAVGFSKDKFVGSDDMVACVLNGSRVEVKHIYGAYSKLQVTDLNEGATVLKVSYDLEHKIIHCVFTRKKMLKSVPQYFNLKRKWYMLFASGSVKKGKPLLQGLQEVTKRKVSLERPMIYSQPDVKLTGKEKTLGTEKQTGIRKDMTSVPGNNTIPTGMFKPPEFFNLNKCGKYDQCAKVPSNCEWNNCLYSIRIKENKAGNSLTFLLTGKSNGWIAVAFSKDKSMNEDDTVFCISDKTRDSTDVKHAYTGAHYIQEINTAEQLNIHSASSVDGYISCKFTRRKNVPENDMMFDLHQPHYIFLGSGPVTSSIQRPMRHSSTPLISEYKVNFNSSRGVILFGEESSKNKNGPLTIEQPLWPFEITSENGRDITSENGGPPELQLFPNRDVISYRPTVPASYMKFVRVLSTFIPDSTTHPTCNPGTKFGYIYGCPCFIIKFTENEKKWSPLPYHPFPLPKTIKKIYDESHLPLTCEGKTNADKHVLGSVVVTPSAGFLSDDLENSFVTVQLMSPKKDVSIRVVCFIWAANIDHSRAEGRIHFLVKIKSPAH